MIIKQVPDIVALCEREKRCQCRIARALLKAEAFLLNLLPAVIVTHAAAGAWDVMYCYPAAWKMSKNKAGGTDLPSTELACCDSGTALYGP